MARGGLKTDHQPQVCIKNEKADHWPEVAERQNKADYEPINMTAG